MTALRGLAELPGAKAAEDRQRAREWVEAHADLLEDGMWYLVMDVTAEAQRQGLDVSQARVREALRSMSGYEVRAGRLEGASRGGWKALYVRRLPPE